MMTMAGYQDKLHYDDSQHPLSLFRFGACQGLSWMDGNDMNGAKPTTGTTLQKALLTSFRKGQWVYDKSQQPIATAKHSRHRPNHGSANNDENRSNFAPDLVPQSQEFCNEGPPRHSVSSL
jgi:hypothetical protein